MKYFIIFISTILLFSTSALLAQDDVPILKYDEVYTHQFTEEGEQFFAQFEGTEGDVVYVLAEYDGFVVGSIEIDLRDTVGRTVGFKQEYAFDEFIIAALPQTALYTVVVTAEEAEPVEIVVGTSGYLEDGVEATITEDGFKKILGIKTDTAGEYQVSYSKTSGSLATNFTIVTFSRFFNENILTVSGTDVGEWTATVDIKPGEQYVAFLDRNIFSGGGKEASVRIEMKPKE